MDKGENSKRSWQILNHTNIWEIVIIMVIFTLVFYSGYGVWFFSGWGKDPVKERVMTFNVETSFSDTGSDRVFMTNEQYENIRQTLEEIQKYNDDNHENWLSISTLNGFYASLFTAIAVIIAIIGLISWRQREEIQEAIKQYKDLKSDVDFLLKKKKYAEWVEKKFESKKNNSSNISFKLNLNDYNDQKALEDITESVIAEHEATAWLEVIIAHELVSDQDSIDEEKLKDAEKIYIFNENRNLFKPNSAIEPYLYHFMGELYHTKFEKYQQKYNEAQLVDILEKSREGYVLEFRIV